MSLLDSLPRPGERRLAVRLSRDAQRQVRGGHPWIYPDSITSVSHDGAAGDLAVLFDRDRKFLAIGLWDPSSPIRVRVLHQGGARPIDEAFWGERLDAALGRRAELAASAQGPEARRTTGYRCLHGENDQLPGLVLDRYDRTYVLKLDTHAWLAHLSTLVPLIVARTGAERIVLRLSRNERSAAAAAGLADGAVLHGDAPPALVRFVENGLHFDADVVRGQKTGHFLDQRDNRARVRELAAGARVLDVFSCSGGFSVYAAAGGAASVHSVDQSPHAIGAVERNLAANCALPKVASCIAESHVGDAFAVLRELAAGSARFDLVIVDPPSFASKQADRESALAAYRRLTELALELTEPGGVLVQSSCSSRVGAEAFFDGIHAVASERGRPLEELQRTGHAVDHPIGFALGAYLKTLFARVP